MRSYLLAAAFVVVAAPAFANPPQQQSQSQVAAAQSASQSGAASRSSSKSFAGAAAGSIAGGGSSSSDLTSGDTSLDTKGDDVTAYGVSYVDSAPQVPQAVVGDGVVITSQNLKVLGPVFGYAWQTPNLTPSGLGNMVDLVQTASTNDTTGAGRSKQASALAVICTYKPELADARFGEKACDRIGEIVESAK